MAEAEFLHSLIVTVLNPNAIIFSILVLFFTSRIKIGEPSSTVYRLIEAVRKPAVFP